MTTLGVRESCQDRLGHARYVSVRPDALTTAAARVLEAGNPPDWDTVRHLDSTGDDLIQYLFLLDTLNFCFWGDPKWAIEFHGQRLDGYWALAASLTRAIQVGRPLLDAKYLAAITEEDLLDIFSGHHIIPMLSERVQAAQELGHVLNSRYDGKSVNLLAAADSAVGLVEIVTSEISSFNDVVRDHDREVRFYKRAQILAADLAAAGAVTWPDLASLTCFADYKVPQVLRALGVLEYVPTLANRIDAKVEIPVGSAEEIEIRAATVVAVELLRDTLAATGKSLTSSQVDYRLWELGQGNALQLSPYHRTRTIYY